MAIQGLPPIEIPAVPAKIYDSRWLNSIFINTPSLMAGSATIYAVGFNPATNEIQPGPPREILEIKDLWKAVTVLPVCQNFMAAYLAMYPVLKEWTEAGSPDVWPVPVP